jgi:hypothetical protein
MKENFDVCFKLMLVSEGGYVNNPADPGGMTNLGVTKANWENYVGHQVDEKVMKSLTPDLVKPFYKSRYWDKISGDDLPDGLDYACFDYAVNSGPVRSAKCLQECANVKVDGVIGPKTLQAVALFNPRELIQDVCDKRLAFLQGLPTWHVFGKGWGARVAKVKKTALKMAE